MGGVETPVLGLLYMTFRVAEGRFELPSSLKRKGYEPFWIPLPTLRGI
jgi:hypothetical protein